MNPLLNLLTLAAQLRHHPDALPSLRAHLHAGLNWPDLIDLARSHRMLPIVATELLKHAGPPPAVTQHLSEHLRSNARQVLSLTAHLSQLLSLLASHDVPAIPFKGPVLASSLYGSLALREAGDLDVLVPRSHVHRARQLLISRGHVPVFPTSTSEQTRSLRSLTGSAERGYVESHAEHHLVRETPSGETINIDLHWSIALNEFGLPIDPRSLWSDLRETTFAGRTIQAFSPEQLLLVLCINGAKDCWRRLDRVCDVAELLWKHPGLDWDRVHAIADQWGSGRILFLGVDLASQVLRAPIPSGVADRLTRDPAVSRLTRQIIYWLDTQSTPVETTLPEKRFHLATREGIAAKARYAFAQLRPTVGDSTTLPLPRAISFVHYALRPLRLMTSALRRSLLPALSRS